MAILSTDRIKDIRVRDQVDAVINGFLPSFRDMEPQARRVLEAIHASRDGSNLEIPSTNSISDKSLKMVLDSIIDDQ